MLLHRRSSNSYTDRERRSERDVDRHEPADPVEGKGSSTQVRRGEDGGGQEERAGEEERCQEERPASQARGDEREQETDRHRPRDVDRGADEGDVAGEPPDIQRAVAEKQCRRCVEGTGRHPQSPGESEQHTGRRRRHDDAGVHPGNESVAQHARKETPPPPALKVQAVPRWRLAGNDAPTNFATW